MKKIAFVIVLSLCSALVFAQAQSSPPSPRLAPQPPNQIAAPAAATASGQLVWFNGRVSVKSGGKTLYVSGLGQLLGFVDGLKEGASVSLEGHEWPVPNAPDYAFFRVTKLTFNGKTYELASANGGFGPGFGQGFGPGFSRNSGPGARQQGRAGFGPDCDKGRSRDKRHPGRER
jgi:hypothetical protein